MTTPKTPKPKRKAPATAKGSSPKKTAAATAKKPPKKRGRPASATKARKKILGSTPRPKAAPASTPPPAKPKKMGEAFVPHAALSQPEPPPPPPPSFTVQDFQKALQDIGPPPDADVETLTATALRWHAILAHTCKTTTELAWKIGQLLARVKLQVKHGEWYEYLNKR